MFTLKNKYFLIIESIKDLNLKNIKKRNKFNIIYRNKKNNENIADLLIFRRGLPGSLVAAILEGINISVFAIINLPNLCV